MKNQFTCDEMGVCARRRPACQGCVWRLAPGTIDGPYHSTRQRQIMRRCIRLVQDLLLIAGLLGVAAGLGCLLGYVTYHLPRWWA